MQSIAGNIPSVLGRSLDRELKISMSFGQHKGKECQDSGTRESARGLTHHPVSRAECGNLDSTPHCCARGLPVGSVASMVVIGKDLLIASECQDRRGDASISLVLALALRRGRPDGLQPHSRVPW